MIQTIAAVSAQAFSGAFLQSYRRVRGCFTIDERWREIWNFSWSAIMLWQPTETFHPPSEISQSVLAQTATQLRLQYPPGEPLRIDAVFSENITSWFPIVVAIEHENACNGFESEITKLLSVRCPLKVGITYTYSLQARQQEVLSGIARIIIRDFAEVAKVVSEDPNTEYLFLIGSEVREARHELDWHALVFRAGDGPIGKDFERVEG